MTYDDLRALWLGAGAAYGIPWQVLAAINKIESNFGRNMGPSSAGAVGWMQFMPDTWLRWGTDGNGDGVADPWNPDDGVYSAARYLAAAEGRTDISRAIFAYNHAQWYVDDVLRLAAMFGGASQSDVVFELDRLGIALEDAQETVASLSESLAAAEERQSELQAPAEAAQAEAQDLSLLLSDRLDAEKSAFETGQAYDAATAEVERLRVELEQAEAALEAAQSGAHSASFVPAAADMLGMPSRADGYVFPVGGGPALVSVGHTHHDYRGRRHRGAARNACLRTRGCARGEPCRRRSLRDRADASDRRGPQVDLLPPLASRQCRAARCVPERRAVGRARRLDRQLDRPAPPSRPHARPLSAGDAVVPGVRGHRVHLAGHGSPVGLAAGPGLRPDSLN